MDNVYTFELNDSSIDEISELILTHCSNKKCDKKSILRIRLSVEETLLCWRDNGFRNHKINIVFKRKILTDFIEIELTGKEFNPLNTDNNSDDYSRRILESLNIIPQYRYSSGTNIIEFRIPKKHPGQLQQLFTVIILAVSFGVLGKCFLPANVIDLLMSNIITPVSDAFYSLLGCVAGPMIFLSVTWGIYGIGDSKTFSLIGKHLILDFFLVTVITTVGTLILLPVIGPVSGFGMNISGQIGSIIEMILAIIPSNIVEPFETGNTLQIIFMGIIVGVALLFLGEMTAMVAKAIGQINSLIIFLMKFISKLVPYVVFLVIVSLIWSGSIEIFSQMWKFLVILIAAYFVVMSVSITTTGMRLKVNIILLLKKNIDALIVAFVTASSAATFATNTEICRKRFGIRSNITNFGIPLGMIVNKPCTAVYNMLIVLYFAGQEGITVDIAWILTMLISVVLISISTPPIPGGGAAAYALLFTQAGIPIEMLSVVLAIDMITDFFVTSSEMFCLPLSLLNSASKIGMVDRNILESEQW